jgi:hypothetical protein
MGKWLGPPHEEIPRCGAKTRPGHPCGHYAMKNGRCRFHGGKSKGAKNPPIKHGRYTKKAIANNKCLSELLKESNQTVADIERHIKRGL